MIPKLQRVLANIRRNNPDPTTGRQLTLGEIEERAKALGATFNSSAISDWMNEKKNRRLGIDNAWIFLQAIGADFHDFQNEIDVVMAAEGRASGKTATTAEILEDFEKSVERDVKKDEELRQAMSLMLDLLQDEQDERFQRIRSLIGKEEEANEVSG